MQERIQHLPGECGLPPDPASTTYDVVAKGSDGREYKWDSNDKVWRTESPRAMTWNEQLAREFFDLYFEVDLSGAARMSNAEIYEHYTKWHALFHQADKIMSAVALFKALGTIEGLTTQAIAGVRYKNARKKER